MPFRAVLAVSSNPEIASLMERHRAAHAQYVADNVDAWKAAGLKIPRAAAWKLKNDRDLVAPVLPHELRLAGEHVGSVGVLEVQNEAGRGRGHDSQGISHDLAASNRASEISARPISAPVQAPRPARPSPAPSGSVAAWRQRQEDRRRAGHKAGEATYRQDNGSEWTDEFVVVAIGGAS